MVSREEEAQTEIWEILFNHKKRHFYCEGSQTPDQIARQVVESTTLGGTQNPTGSGPEQSVLLGAGRVGLGVLQRSLATSTLLCYCDKLRKDFQRNHVSNVEEPGTANSKPAMVEVELLVTILMKLFITFPWILNKCNIFHFGNIV